MKSFADERFDVSLTFGQDGEHEVQRLFGVDAADIEVKRSTRNDSTFYIEVQKFSYGQWVPSGINKTEATHWALTGPTLSWTWVVKTDVLKDAVLAAIEAGRTPITNYSGTQNTKGYLVTIDQMIEAE